MSESELNSPLLNLGDQETERRLDAPYVRQMRSVTIEGFEVQPPADLAWAYQEEKERIEIRAQQKRWSQRKKDKELKDLRDKLKDEVKSRSKSDKKHSDEPELKTRESVTVKTREIPTDTDGNILPFSLEKKEQRTRSDDERVGKKKAILEMTENDRRNVFLRKDMKGLIDEIREYAKINATSTTLAYKRSVYYSKARIFDTVAKYQLKDKQKQLDEERELARSIKDKIERMLENATGLEKEILQDYKARLSDSFDGTLDITDESISVIDYSTRVMKQTDTGIEEKTVKGEKVEELKKRELKTKDRSGEVLFAHEPCSKDITQRSFGDCYFMTTLNTIVSEDPDRIRAMMKDEGDAVTVRFFKVTHDKESNTYTTSPQFVKVSKVTVSDAAGADTLWVQIMEKAYAVFLRENPDQGFKVKEETLFAQKGGDLEDELDYVHMSHGGLPDIAEQHLLGVTGQSKLYLTFSSKTADIISDPVKTIRQVYTSSNAEQVNEWLEKRKEKVELRDSFEKAIKEDYAAQNESSVKELEEEAKKFEKEHPDQTEAIKQKKEAVRIARNEFIDAQAKKVQDDADIKKLEEEIYQYEKQIQELEFSQDIGLYTAKSDMDDVKGVESLNIFIKPIYEALLAGRSELKKTYLQDHQKTQDAFEDAKKAYNDQKARLSELKEKAGDKPTEEQATEIKTAEDLFMKLETEMKEKKAKLDQSNVTFSSFEKENSGERGAFEVRTRLLQIMNDVVQQIIVFQKELLGIELGDINDAKENYKSILEALKKFECSKTDPIGNLALPLATGIQDYCGLSLETIVSYMKQMAVEALTRVVERFDTSFDKRTAEAFTGVYTDDAIEAYEAIENAFKEKRNVTASTRTFTGRKGSGHAGEHIEGGIASTHAYDVLGVETFEYGGKQIRFVKVRNPWGHYITCYRYNTQTKKVEPMDNRGKTNGVGLVELTHFTEKFRNLTFGGDAK